MSSQKTSIRPPAPTVYRPQAIQPKPITKGPPVYRPTIQPKMKQQAPPAYRPTANPVQQKCPGSQWSGPPITSARQTILAAPPIYRPAIQMKPASPIYSPAPNPATQFGAAQGSTSYRRVPSIDCPQPLASQAKPVRWPVPRPVKIEAPKTTLLQPLRQPIPRVGVIGIPRSQAIQRASTCLDFLCKIPACPGGHPPTAPPSYTQASDPSIKPFLSGGSQRMGDRAFAKQVKGKKPTAADVRVKAFKRKGMRAGAGMHEFQPTDTASSVASKPELAPYQSGARSSTDLTLFSTPGGLGGHTGLFPKAKGRGSTHTKRQKEGHDALRKVKVQGSTPKERNLHRLQSAISGLAHGKEIVESDFVTGALPNRIGGTPLEPVSKPGPSRWGFARRLHQRRENVKRRFSTLSTASGFNTRPASPPRDPIDKFGGGGDYTYAVQGPPSPLPSFPEPDTAKAEADMFAWTTAPLRHDSSYSSSIECKACGHLNINREKTCENCSASL